MNVYDDDCLQYFNRDRIINVEDKIEKEVKDINLLKILLENKMRKIEERIDKLEKANEL